ncbi:hypothetical protein HYR99_09060 [Candidatus Poribacteria bacterium]|nr:hypothetical protein [Candidatus Poribacteria bacterium]
MRRDAKVDHNQREIVSALRQIGASVYPLHFAGNGCPDLLVGFRGKNFLMEVKTERGRLNADQRTFHASWRGHVAVVKSASEAVSVICES